MNRITFTDIRKRLYGLQSTAQTSNVHSFVEAANSLIEMGNSRGIKNLIENAANSKERIPFSTYLDLLEAFVECGTASDIKKYGDFIASEAVTKTRDAKQLQTLLKRRISRVKSKILGASTVEPVKIDGASTVKKQIQVKKKPNDQAKNEALIAAYETISEAVEVAYNCDRVIENYNKISKRFNLELLFVENTRANGTKDTVIELCNWIDTYNMPTIVKFNTVIETALYGFESNSIDYKRSDILEAASDYFAFKPDGVQACNQIMNATLFFDKDEDAGNVDILMEEEPETKAPVGSPSCQIEAYCNGGVMHRFLKEADENQDSDFEKLFKKFKQEELAKDDKPQNKLKALVSKLYTRSVSGVVDDTPKLLSWLRSFFILATGAIPTIGPIIMVIGFIADRFISLHMDRKQTEQMIKCFANEIKTSKAKLETVKTPEEKERLNKYIDSLKQAKDKILRYHDNLLGSDEYGDDIEGAEDDDYTPSGDLDGFDAKEFLDDADSDDFDFDDFMESGAVQVMAEAIESLSKDDINKYITDDTMFRIVADVSGDDLMSIATLAAKYPENFCRNAVTDGIRHCMKYDKIDGTSVDRSLRLSDLYAAKEIIDNTDPESAPKTIKEAAVYVGSLKEAYEAIIMLVKANTNRDTFIEASIGNTLKMASMKLRKALQGLSDKEKSISRSIDLGMNNMSKSVEKALTTDNREAVIKGSILPSASKMIKLGIVNAGLIAIGQPVLAVITTLGYLGVSSRFKAKERQMLVDEIEIELKMCQKYIDIAESKNDMKALKQLLMIQRDLERQHQRIKYKMKADLGQKYYDAKHVGDN